MQYTSYHVTEYVYYNLLLLSSDINEYSHDVSNRLGFFFIYHTYKH